MRRNERIPRSCRVFEALSLTGGMARIQNMNPKQRFQTLPGEVQ
jgi:hypothetical protein